MPLSDRRVRGLLVGIIISTLLLSAPNGWHRGGPTGALLDASGLLSFYIVAGGLMWLVETRLSGRARLWGRIAELSF